MSDPVPICGIEFDPSVHKTIEDPWPKPDELIILVIRHPDGRMLHIPCYLGPIEYDRA